MRVQYDRSCEPRKLKYEVDADSERRHDAELLQGGDTSDGACEPKLKLDGWGEGEQAS